MGLNFMPRPTPPCFLEVVTHILAPTGPKVVTPGESLSPTPTLQPSTTTVSR